MNRFKIQYFSDLHLEFYDLTKLVRMIHWIKPKSDICVLAGDIGYPFQKKYEVFLIAMNKKFEHIFLILGNHEFYQLKDNEGKTMNQIIEQTEKIIKSNNLTNVGPSTDDSILFISKGDFTKSRVTSKTDSPFN